MYSGPLKISTMEICTKTVNLKLLTILAKRLDGNSHVIHKTDDSGV